MNTDPSMLQCRKVLWCSVARSNVQLRNAEPTCSDSARFDTAEVALVEHHAFGAQPAEIVVAEVVADEFPLDPDCFVDVHRLSRAARSGC